MRDRNFFKPLLSLLAGGVLMLLQSVAGAEEVQVTHGSEFSHHLDNNDNFSPDDRFLVFDTRAAEGYAESRRIAKVEIATGEVTMLYETRNANEFGPVVMAASFAHQGNRVAFIHGPADPTGPENQYEKHRRIGGVASGDGSREIRFADARDIAAPYTVGALRGGTHRHEFSGDGQWIGFTYNDAVVRAHGLKIGNDLDLRTIGVTKLGRPVTVPESSQFPTESEGFSVLVVVVTPDPQLGSDEISYAAGDSWVGRNGYLRDDGQRQLARAFIGTVRDKQGQPVDELFIVDIPEDITKPGPLGPLEGTDTQFPMPPAGTVQRRLTHTSESRHTGCVGIARSSHDGSQIAFQMQDENDHLQVFLISPNGGEPKQATFVQGGVTSDARWHPSGNFIACVAENKILITDVRPGEEFGKSKVLNDRAPAPFALVWSHDGKTLAYNRTVNTNGQNIAHIFVADCKTLTE
ncbi:MAG: DUF3748 domain-containing protein [Planctomycetaceae bacterium]|nr:DUF3748 domain-containing protein [Planctomycetaceae bacterium]